MKAYLFFLLFCLEALLLARWPDTILSHPLLLGGAAMVLWAVVAATCFTRDPATLLPRGLTWFNTTCLYQALILTFATMVR